MRNLVTLSVCVMELFEIWNRIIPLLLLPLQSLVRVLYDTTLA